MAPYFGLRGSRLILGSIIAIVMPAFVCFGFTQTSGGAVLPLYSFYTQFPALNTFTVKGSQEHHNSLIQGTVVSIYTVGGIFGSLSCVWFGDLLGRRKTIFVANVVAIIGSVIISSSFSLAQLIVGRIVLGVGMGGVIASIPVWQSELSKPTHRGKHVVTEAIFITSGLFVCLWIFYGLSFVQDNSVSWRFPLALPIIFNFTVLCLIFSFPESPRWLLKHGRRAEALKILAALEDAPEDSPKVQTDLRSIEISIELVGQTSLKDLLKMGKHRYFHRVVLGSLIQVFLQLTGVNVVAIYATVIFEVDLGYSQSTSRILSAMMQLTATAGGFCCFFTIERFGRRKLLIASAIAQSICFAIIAGTTSNPHNQKALIAAVVFFFVYTFVYVMGFLGIPFLYAAEIAPQHLRAAMSGVSVGFSWAFNFLVLMVTPVGFTTIGYKYYIVYACINAAIAPLIYFFFPETSGRSLEDINLIFEHSKNIFDPVKVAKRLPREHLNELVDSGNLEIQHKAMTEQKENVTETINSDVSA